MARCQLLPPADSAVRAGRLDIIGVHVSTSATGATLADVTLHAWQQDGSFTVEYYSLLRRSDRQWTVHKYEEYCCETVHRLESIAALPLIVLNGRPLLPGTELRDALVALRGQVIDSIALLPGIPKEYQQYGRWGVANGVVIIATRVAARKPE